MDDSLSPRQFKLLLWAAMLAPLVRLSPGAMLPGAGRGVWLSALLSLPAAGLLSALAGALLSCRRPGESPGAMLCRVLGTRLARVLGLGAGLWLCFCCGFTLRAGADRLVAAVYPESPPGLFAALTLLLCLPAALGELRTLGRMAELCAPLLLGLFVLVLALALPQTELGSLLPAREELRGLLPGALPLLGSLSAGVFFLLLWGETVPEKPGRVLFLPLGGLSVTALGLCAVVTGSFGPALTRELRYPFFVMLRNLQLPRLLERGEALVAAAWVISDYLLCAAQLHMASRALGGCFPAPGGAQAGQKAPVWLSALLAGLGAALCGTDAFFLERLGRDWIPLVDLALGFGLPGLLLLPARRKKAGESRKK